jgi:hypothetical protein
MLYFQVHFGFFGKANWCNAATDYPLHANSCAAFSTKKERNFNFETFLTKNGSISLSGQFTFLPKSAKTKTKTYTNQMRRLCSNLAL